MCYMENKLKKELQKEMKKGSGFVKWVSVGVIVLTILILFNIIDLKHLLNFML